MIINNQYKYIFVGLPFSASTSISRTLCKDYGGKQILNKHTNITALLNQKSQLLKFPLSEYHIFAVYRDPVDIALTTYTKLKHDPYNLYSNSDNLSNNGGWVSGKAFKYHKLLKRKDYSFSEYISLRYKIPYDSVFSLNLPYLSSIVDFDNLEADFEKVMNEIGFKEVVKLDYVNKTDHRNQHKLDGHTKSKIFGPFLSHVGRPPKNKVGIINKFLFYAAKPFRYIRWKKRDIKILGKEFKTDFELFE
jgi:hypothetical protein